MRFNRLSYQILLVFVLVIVVCLGVSGWFVIRISENIVTRKISEGDLNFAGRIAQQVAAEMASVKPTLTLLAGSTGLRLMEATGVKDEIDRAQRSFPDITSIYVADVEGEQIARTVAGKLENVSGIRSFQVARGGDELVSDIYLKPVTSEPMQTIALPIIDSGAVVGVLSADICFTRIMVLVMDIYIGKTGIVVVVADNGMVVAHTRRLQVREFDLARLPVVEAVLAGEEGAMKGYTDELGRQVLGSYMPIRELGWGVLIQRPLADIDAEVGQLRTTIILVMIAAILLVVPVGWLMSRQIAKPIGQLVSASEKVAQGDLSTPVDIKSSNEVGVLAHSFNQMLVSLKKSRDDLQQWGEELRESEEKFRKVFESSNDAMMLLDENEFFDCNNATLRIFGCTTRKEFCGKHPSEVSPLKQVDGKDSRKAVDERIAEASREGSCFFEWTHRRINGEDFPAEVLLTSMEIGGRKVIQATVRDVTDRKKAEEALQKAHEELEAKVEERTKNLKEKTEKLERINKLFVDRELRMKELKEEIKKLKRKMQE